MQHKIIDTIKKLLRREVLEKQQAASGLEKDSKERGIALIIAIMTIALMITFVSEMIVSSAVNLELAVTVRDRIKSEYMAKSGVNLGVYAVSASYLLDHVNEAYKKEIPTDGSSSLWGILNNLPPIGATALELASLMADPSSSEDAGDADASDPFQLGGFMNEEAAEKMRLLQDDFSVNISDEVAKINLSVCSSSKEARRPPCKYVIEQLEALFSCPAEKAFLASKNLEPTNLALKIRDFITSSDKIESDIGSKHAPYESLIPSYKAKGLPFDTVNELKLVQGWDDDVHAVFSPYLRTFPVPSANGKENGERININTIKQELMLCLLPVSDDERERESTIQQLHQLKSDGENFASNEKEIQKKIDTIFGNEDGRLKSKGKWFTQRSDVFRISSLGQTGKQVSKLTVIINRVDKGNTEKRIKDREVQRAYTQLYWSID